MRTYRLRVAYHGADFHGWQVQPDRRTVQGCLLEAARPLVAGPESVELAGASRTDAGVHALGQAAHLRLERERPLEPGAVLRALNSRLPPDVRVLEARSVPEGFNARTDAVQKWYRYRVLERDTVSVLEAGYSWHLRRRLDLEAVRAAAAALVGEHDYSAFAAKVEHPDYRPPSTVRRVDRVQVGRASPMLWFDVLGRAFLYRMVRNMVGTLVEVGEGRRSPGSVAEALASGDRRRAGVCAPPQGLFLMGVRYQGDPDFEVYDAPVLEPPTECV